jgi:hypothetical protein
VEHTLGDLRRSILPDGKRDAVANIQGLAADASTSLQYASGLYQAQLKTGTRRPADVHTRAERSIKRAIEGFYYLGQVLADPQLLERSQVTVASVDAVGGRILPGQPGFDPWVLTDPATRDHWRQDPRAMSAIATLWSSDPDPAATLAIQGEIDAAVAAGHVKRGVTAGGESLGNFFCCPWASIYLVLRPVRIDRESFRAGEQFTVDVSAEGLAHGGSFKRNILRGPFSPTTEIDYCDPTANGDHD